MRRSTSVTLGQKGKSCFFEMASLPTLWVLVTQVVEWSLKRMFSFKKIGGSLVAWSLGMAAILKSSDQVRLEKKKFNAMQLNSA